ncbi:MAG: PepSY-like domain-containing protein [bacterium]
MKKFSIALLLLLLAQATYSQELKITKKTLPPAVLTSFTKSYPAAKIHGMNKETKKGVTYYEIESSEGKVKRDVLYTSDGSVAEVEEIIGLGEIPQAIKDAVTKQNPKDKITSAEKVMRGTSIQYDLEMKSKNKSYEVSYSLDGTLIQPHP